MLKKFIFIAGLFLTSLSVTAGHAGIFEIFYSWTSDSTYQFTVVLYKNCSGFTVPPPSIVTIRYQSSSLSVNSTFSAPMMAATGPNTPPLQPPGMLNCSNGSYCWEEYTYRGSWTSPGRADDWIFSYDLCCIPANFPPANVQTGNLYNECMLNNLDFPDSTQGRNISSLFHNRRPNYPGYLNDTVLSYPKVSVCGSREVKIDQSVRNYDGDKIKYELFHPQGTGGAPLTYVNGYTFANPLPTDGPPLSIDSSTGIMEFKVGAPTHSGIYYVGIRATEYRDDSVWNGSNWTLVEKRIGYVQRHLFVVIEDSSICPDLGLGFTDSTDFSTVVHDIDVNCGNNPIEVGISFEIKCNSIDANGSSLHIVDTVSMDTMDIVNVTPVNCSRRGLTQSFRIQLNTPLSPGGYIMYVDTGTDGNTMATECDLHLSPQQHKLRIYVADPGFLGEIIADTTKGTVTSMTVPCGTKIFDIGITSAIRCASIIPDGSDIELRSLVSGNKVPLRKLTPLGCNDNFSEQVRIEALQPIDPGNYTVQLVIGSDGNSFVDECFRELDTTSVSLTVEDFPLDLGSDFTYCYQDTTFDTLLTAPPGAASYQWSTGSQVNRALIFTSGTYWLTMTSALGCIATDTVVVSAVDCYTGIGETSGVDVKIYPNPTYGRLNIVLSANVQNAFFELSDISGKTVFQKSVDGGQQVVDMSELSQGMYFYRVSYAGTLQNHGKLQVIK